MKAAVAAPAPFATKDEGEAQVSIPVRVRIVGTKMAAKLRGGLRVHVAPVGYYLDRVYQLPLDQGANRLWLMADKKGETANEGPYLRAIREHLAKEAPRMQVKEKPVDLWSFEDLLRGYAEVVREETEAGNEVWVNVSTGSKVQGVAGALVAMAHGAHPYYVVTKTLEKPPPKSKGRKGPEPLAEGVADVVNLLGYQLDLPNRDEVEILRAIKALGGRGVKKNRVVDRLLGGKWKDEIESKKASKDQAGLMRLNRMLERLRLPPAKIEEEGNTRRRRISLTEQGRLVLTLMGY